PGPICELARRRAGKAAAVGRRRGAEGSANAVHVEAAGVDGIHGLAVDLAVAARRAVERVVVSVAGTGAAARRRVAGAVDGARGLSGDDRADEGREAWGRRRDVVAVDDGGLQRAELAARR